jgi:AcrR family transcriptional regulator
MKRRAKANNQQSNGEQTRDKLIDAGLQAFSDHGFDGVSTRALAQAAGVNQAAILYHFQSKEGLYLAVTEAVVARVKPGLLPLAQAVQERLSAGMTRQQASRDIQAIVTALLRQILTLNAGSSCRIGPFMLREQLKPTAAFDILYQELMEPLHTLLCQLVALVHGSLPTSRNVIIEVQALTGQAIIFGAHRATLLRRLGQASLDEAGIDEIVTVLTSSLARQFA